MSNNKAIVPKVTKKQALKLAELAKKNRIVKTEK